ncbi:glycosyltransferase involved in cell wall biosynthesis [Deinococcus metalli]|uniref:Glycosyl transferase n=1 Tax=Deinococcus metalli TaxID=1141878 RepID=A0A7W8NNM8_9DEIO|nr:glycosyltransferase family 4 protein [Deinococcus metalli]MBB5375936.1 glycosyltransferase involved in cell wall biosynthesis [Deinococcus metalli]GHF35977.1 glycosyl transferase [Deinococcus metalli]
MKILLVHNYYQQPGGEDVVFRAEATLLRDAGHDVEEYTVSNMEIGQQGKAGVAARTVWNAAAARTLNRMVRSGQHDIVHFHNTFPLLSPAVYGAARAAGAATVQTLHNYRIVCASALLFRDGHVCESCLGRLPVPAVRHRCYRDSVGASATVAAMQVAHRVLGTYRRDVDAYVALTEFARDKFIQGGLPATRLHVKPNFIDPDPGAGPGGGGYALFVGRLTEEKGVQTLLDAWRRIGTALPLKVLGSGPLVGDVEQAAGSVPGVTYLGQRGREEVMALAARAECLIFPSRWYEGFPMTIVESLAVGLPVIASRIGAMEQLIQDGVNGMHFEPGNADDLVRAVQSFLAGDRPRMRNAARETFVKHYTSAENLRQLMYIYGQARKAGGATE